MAHETLRIVIADNESIIRMDLREMLEEAGHEIVGEAVDGWHAVETTRARRPDLVIMDIKMPEMDGITAAKKNLRRGYRARAAAHRVQSARDR